MIQRRTNRAPNSMGNMVPMLGSGYAAPGTRRCARCKCKLSRYAAQTETMCAPCSSTLHPWEAPRERRRDAWRDYAGTKCKCGAPKTTGAKRCLRCHIAMIGAGHPSWYGKTCACGGRKSEESRQCNRCRYPNTRRGA